MHAQRFDCFGPKALGGIGRLPGTLDDRSIIITLKRRIRSEPVRRLRMREAREEAAPMRDRLAAWGENAFPQLQEARPDSPDELDDRAQDSWDPLLAIADLADEGWPQKARDAALALSAGIEPEDDSVGVRLLADLAFIFGTDDAKTTVDLLTALNQMYEAPWPGFHKGAGIQARDLARLLRPFGVRPCNVRVGEVQSKGYQQECFIDAWNRYASLPSAIIRPIRPTGADQAQELSVPQSQFWGVGTGDAQARARHDGTDGTDKSPDERGEQQSLASGDDLVGNLCAICQQPTPTEDVVIYRTDGGIVCRECDHG